MPIYEYQCQNCGEVLEALQKLSDAPLVDCPACGKPALKKKVSAVAFRLKGSGWYETDFKTGDKKNLVGDGDSAGSKDTGNKESGSEGSAAGSSEKSGESKAGSAKSSAKSDSKSTGKSAGGDS